jgi:hypothetical protein
MKVALILTGHMRDWEDFFPTIKQEILDRYNPDVYISSFNHNLDSIREYDTEEGHIIDDRKDDLEYFNIAKILEYYKPKKYIFRDDNYQLDFKFNTISIERIPREWAERNILSWHTVYLSLELINLEDYDIIIRARPDVYVRNIKLYRNENLVIPDLCVDPGPCTINEGLYPDFAYGNSKYMQKYLATYEKLQEMHSKGLTDISVREMTLMDYVKKYIGLDNICMDPEIEWRYKDTEWSTQLREMQFMTQMDNPLGWFEHGQITQEELDFIMKATETGE